MYEKDVRTIYNRNLLESGSIFYYAGDVDVQINFHNSMRLVFFHQ